MSLLVNPAVIILACVLFFYTALEVSTNGFIRTMSRSWRDCRLRKSKQPASSDISSIIGQKHLPKTNRQPKGYTAKYQVSLALSFFNLSSASDKQLFTACTAAGTKHQHATLGPSRHCDNKILTIAPCVLISGSALKATSCFQRQLCATTTRWTSKQWQSTHHSRHAPETSAGHHCLHLRKHTDQAINVYIYMCIYDYVSIQVLSISIDIRSQAHPKYICTQECFNGLPKNKSHIHATNCIQA